MASREEGNILPICVYTYIYTDINIIQPLCNTFPYSILTPSKLLFLLFFMDHQLSLSPFAWPTCDGKLLLTQRPAQATGLSTEGLEFRVEGIGLRFRSSRCRDMQPHLALELERLASP